jgi:hypothetical protein
MTLSFNSFKEYNSMEHLYRDYVSNHQLWSKSNNQKTIIENDLKVVQNNINKYKEIKSSWSNSITTCTTWLFSLVAIPKDNAFDADQNNENKTDLEDTEFYTPENLDIWQNKAILYQQNLNDLNQTITEVSRKLLKSQSLTLNYNIALGLIIEACGGANSYNELAELPLANRKGHDRCIAIKAEEMSSPIMKFIDGRGKKGIAICARNKETKNIVVQTFFQSQPESSNWTASTPSIITLEGYFIENGCLNVAFFDQFKLLLANTLTSWELYSKKMQEVCYVNCQATTDDGQKG